MDISNGESFVPLRGPANRDEGTQSPVEATCSHKPSHTDFGTFRTRMFVMDLKLQRPSLSTRAGRAQRLPQRHPRPQPSCSRTRFSRRQQAALRLEPNGLLVSVYRTSLNLRQVPTHPPSYLVPRSIPGDRGQTRRRRQPLQRWYYLPS